LSFPGRLLGLGRGRRGLRRFSPERAGTRRSPSLRRPPLGKAGEKLTVAILAGVAAAALLGFDAGLDRRAWVGLAVLVATAFATFARYLVDFRPRALASLPGVVALALWLLVPLAAAQLASALFGLHSLFHTPFALLGLVLALVWSRGLAIEGLCFSAVLLVLFAYLRPEWEGAPQGLGIALAGGLAACLAADRLRRRSALIRVGILVGLVQMLVGGAALLLDPNVVPPGGTTGGLLLYGASGLATGFVVSGSLPAVERLFGVTTDVSLLELGNTHEQPLLRKLLLEAPGTFHHSYIVGLLSEAAAEAVGANPLLARVGALYHDIGKLNKPAYFAENSPDARARHKDLTPEMSTLVISAHTRDGVELGSYYGLPRSVLDFMPEHHGTNCIEYFFERAKALRGAENVNQEQFRYPGPRPQSIETAIVMISDAVEAISRQMPDPSRARLEGMVHEVVLKRLMDRQFDDSGITLRDLERIEGACVQVLMGIYHTRPTFPKGRPHPLDLSQPAEERQPQRGADPGVGRSAAGGP